MKSNLPTSDAVLVESRARVLPDLLARSARLYPDKEALRFGNERRSFGQLDARSSRLGNALAARGVGRGDNVAFLLHDGIEVIEAFFGCQKIGACPVPVNFRLVQDEIDYIVGNSDAVGVIADEHLAPAASRARDRMAAVRFQLVTGSDAAGEESYEVALAEASSEQPGVVVADADLAFLMYTSGTTGRPKGAMLSHLNLVANTMNWVEEMQISHDDVWLSGLPLFHIGGVNGVLPFIYAGREAPSSCPRRASTPAGRWI